MYLGPEIARLSEILAGSLWIASLAIGEVDEKKAKLNVAREKSGMKVRFHSLVMLRPGKR